MAIESPQKWRERITYAFEHPLEADLDVIRTAVDDRGGWTRPHAHLPRMPQICQTDTCSLTLVKKARSEIRAWMRKHHFDPYFCAGEVIAGFCEVVAWVERFASSLEKESASIVILLIEFYHEIIYENIDSSDGVHIFAEAYLERLLSALKDLGKIAEEEYIQFSTLLQE